MMPMRESCWSCCEQRHGSGGVVVKTMEKIETPHWCGFFCSLCESTSCTLTEKVSCNTVAVPFMMSQSLRSLTFAILNVSKCICCDSLYCIPRHDAVASRSNITSLPFFVQCYRCSWRLKCDDTTDWHRSVHVCKSNTPVVYDERQQFDYNTNVEFLLCRRAFFSALMEKKSTVDKCRRVRVSQQLVDDVFQDVYNMCRSLLLRRTYVDKFKYTVQESCVVCMDAPPSVTFLSCFHTVTCEQCSAKLKLCPMCRDTII